MCRALCEAEGFKSLDEAPIVANDDKLDAVAWIPFSDALPGQLIVFGQCKTGTNWDGQLTQLQPDVFIKKRMREPLVVDPMRAFSISEAADRSRWKGTCATAGILFDRCRLVDVCDNLPADLLSRIENWTNVAKTGVCFTGA